MQRVRCVLHLLSGLLLFCSLSARAASGFTGTGLEGTVGRILETSPKLQMWSEVTNLVSDQCLHGHG